MRNQIQTAPLALQAVLRMAAMVPDHEDAHAIARDSIEEVIGKAIAVGSPKVGFENVVPVRPMGSVQQVASTVALSTRPIESGRVLRQYPAV